MYSSVCLRSSRLCSLKFPRKLSSFLFTVFSGITITNDPLFSFQRLNFKDDFASSLVRVCHGSLSPFSPLKTCITDSLKALDCF